MSKLDEALQMKCKPFPWRCGHCREWGVHPATLPFSMEVNYDGGMHTIMMPALEVPRCQACGHLVMDSEANRQIDKEIRCRFGLLAPEQIRDKREALGLTQQQLANQLRIPTETLELCEMGGLQERALDTLLRLFFALSEVRAALENKPGELGAPNLGLEIDPDRKAS